MVLLKIDRHFLCMDNLKKKKNFFSLISLCRKTLHNIIIISK